MAKKGTPRKGQKKTGRPKRDRSGDVGFQAWNATQRAQAEERRIRREQEKLEKIRQRAIQNRELVLEFISANQKKYEKGEPFSKGQAKYNSPFFQTRSLGAAFSEFFNILQRKFTVKSFNLKNLVRTVGTAAPDDPALTLKLLNALEEILVNELDKLAQDSLREVMLGPLGVIGRRFLDPPDEDRVPDPTSFRYSKTGGLVTIGGDDPSEQKSRTNWFKFQRQDSLSRKGTLLNTLFSGKPAAGIQPVKKLGKDLYGTFTYAELESIKMDSPSPYNSAFLILEYGTGMFARPGPRRWTGDSTPYKLSPILIQASLTSIDDKGDVLDTARWVSILTIRNALLRQAQRFERGEGGPISAKLLNWYSLGLKGRYSIHNQRGQVLRFKEYPRRVYQLLLRKIAQRLKAKVPEFTGDLF